MEVAIEVRAEEDSGVTFSLGVGVVMDERASSPFDSSENIDMAIELVCEREEGGGDPEGPERGKIGGDARLIRSSLATCWKGVAGQLAPESGTAGERGGAGEDGLLGICLLGLHINV